ncbi:MAG: OmpH family outer membrane protein [Ignavibacteriota bacterium]|nr:OmpH family outer membrane protein [Ignavibacteriota bacterium]
MKPKNLRVVLTFVVLALFFMTGTSRSQTKVGYIDSKKIIETMQEAKDAKQKLDNLVQEWQKQLTDLQDSLKRTKDDFEKKRLILSEQLKQQYEKTIKDLETNVSNFKVQKFGDGGEYFQKQVEFMKPVQDRIFKAIETVAKKDDYDYIFDRNSDLLLLYVNEKYDVTAKVQKVVEGKDK